MFKVLFLMCAMVVCAFTMELSELITCASAKYPEVLTEFRDVFEKECVRTVENPRESSKYLIGAAFFPTFEQVLRKHDLAALDILINEFSSSEMGLQEDELANFQKEARAKLTKFLTSEKTDFRNIALIILRISKIR